jgi:hypothetical protein
MKPSELDLGSFQRREARPATSLSPASIHRFLIRPTTGAGGRAKSAIVEEFIRKTAKLSEEVTRPFSNSKKDS